MEDASSTIDRFLEATASRQPTPGGGSVTALAGALAGAMGEMTVNYSLGKKGLEAYEGELRPALAEFNNARRLMLKLMTEDQTAYQTLTTTRKLPDSAEKTSQYAAALLASIRGPQAMAAAAVAVLEVCDRILNFVNFHLLSDLAVCSDIAMATTRCAIYSVRVNLPQVTDAAERRAIEATTGQILSRAATLIQRVGPRIWARYDQGA